MAYVSSYQGIDNALEDAKKDQALTGGQVSASEGQPAAPAAGNAPASYTQSTFSSGKKIIDKNKDASSPFDVTKNYQQDISQGQNDLAQKNQDLTQAANTYKSGWNLTGDEYSNALKGDQGSYAKLTQALHPQDFQYSYDTPQTKYTTQDVQSLNTKTGLQNAIGQQAKEQGLQNYSRGMGALDASIYGNSAGVRQNVYDLVNKYNDFKNQSDAFGNAVDQTKSDYSGQAMQNADALKNILAGSKNEINRNAQAATISPDQQLQNVANSQRYKDLMIQAEHDAGLGHTAGTDQDPYRALLSGLKASDYIQTAPQNGPTYNNDQAAQYNRIQELLGNGQRVSSGSAAPVINENALKSAVKGKVSGQMTKDKAESDAKQAALDQAESERKAQEAAATQKDQASYSSWVAANNSGHNPNISSTQDAIYRKRYQEDLKKKGK